MPAAAEAGIRKSLREAGAVVRGVDHTTAVDKAASLCAHLPNAAFAQADLKRLPFEPQSFDVVFSIGVMHHDVDTRAVFDAVARLVRPGGRYAVWLYRKNQWWQELLNDALRRAARGCRRKNSSAGVGWVRRWAAFRSSTRRSTRS